MVVPLLALGSATKLAFATAATHRSRAWWLPGTIAIALGSAGTLHAGATRTLGCVSIVLGLAALAVSAAVHARRSIAKAP